MKTPFLVFSIGLLMLCSCSSDDDDNSNSSSINPPSWIQGTWLESDEGPGIFKFTSDNYCQGINGGSILLENCYKKFVENGLGSVKTEQEVNGNFYTIKLINNALGQTLTTTSKFEKISDTQIKYFLFGGGEDFFLF